MLGARERERQTDRRMQTNTRCSLVQMRTKARLSSSIAERERPNSVRAVSDVFVSWLPLRLPREWCSWQTGQMEVALQAIPHRLLFLSLWTLLAQQLLCQ